jgi:hypothetical protein
LLGQLGMPQYAQSYAKSLPGMGGGGGGADYGGGGDATSGLSNVNQGAATIGENLKKIAGSVGGGGGGGGGRGPMPGFQMPEMMAKRGGKVSKKHFATGGAVNDSGHAVAMPKKKPSAPVAISQLSGTFKRGGKVKADDC